MVQSPAPPEPATTLDADTAKRAPQSQGIYAAWIVDEQALAEAGLSGPPPRLVYVGVAAGRGGLRHRLARHAKTPFWDLLDLLAVRGTIVPGWWHYARKNQPHKRTLHPPPLARLASDEALAWQERNLRWGWVMRNTPRSLESELIAAYQPLLNLSGQGLRVLGPPQLRYVGDWEPARAAWLFSVAWIAVLSGRPSGWVRRRLRKRADEIRVDDAGWPMPLAAAGRPERVRIPSEREARTLLSGCLPDTYGTAQFNDDEEARAWWAAYIGLTFQHTPQAVEDALHLAASRRVDAIRTPPTLPDEPRRRELLQLIRLLPRVCH